MLLCSLAAAQTNHFEVASVKPANPAADERSLRTDNVGGLNATNVPIRALITMAYGIRDSQLTGGPAWVGTACYDVMAKPGKMEGAPESVGPGSITDEQPKVRDDLLKERVRNLLTERFGLQVRKEMREEQVYTLTVTKSGPKVTPNTTPGARQGLTMNPGRAQGFAAPMSLLAEDLADTLGRPVIDKTGLTGKYDWKLEWSPEATTGGTEAPLQVNAGPTIFTAMQDQLGLKLESSKGPVEVYVIDHIDRPSEN
jgi:bla regulator protein BlaR1